MTRTALEVLLASCLCGSACGEGSDLPELRGRTPSVIAAPSLPGAHDRGGRSLRDLIAESRRGGDEQGSFRPFDGEAFRRLHEWAQAAARGEISNAGLPSRFAPPVAVESDLHLLRERSERSTGAGVYVVRKTRRTPTLMIQVPHSFWDVGTLAIGLSWFEGLRADALLVNTSHRYRGARCKPPKGDESSSDIACPSDAAHAPQHPFHAFHLGYVEGASGVTTLALHGFDAKEGDPDAIVSAAGTKAPLSDVIKALRAALPEYDIRAYPKETTRLGGTRGVQARTLAKSGGKMVHIEMSRRLRDALSADAELTDRVAAALRRAWKPARR